MKRKNLIKTSFIYGGIIVGLTGCTAKTVDCNIEESHVHLYVNEDNNLSRYVESEKEYRAGIFAMLSKKRSICI